MKKFTCLVTIILIIPFVLRTAFAGGSLYGVDTCPVPGITGYTKSLTFTLQGTSPPPGARITVVTGSCTVYGDFPDTTLVAGGRSTGITSFSYYTSVFTGLSPTISFTLRMSYPGDYGNPSGATPGTCQINVSWIEAAPESTEITGPATVRVEQTIELDGTVANATVYNWSTTQNCTIVGTVNTTTVTVEGTQGGICTVTRNACNSQNECVTDTHDVMVIETGWMIPMYHLLLLQ